MRAHRWVGTVMILSAAVSAAQNSPLQWSQNRDGAPADALSAADFASLGDPLFNLVLRDKAHLVKLSEIEQAIQPDSTKRRLFVVSERIVSDAQTSGRRAVLAFVGANGGEELQGNVMLSFSFGPNGPSELVDIEAWGWDSHRRRYNYYKLDRTGIQPAQRVWKFRGSSERADLLQPSEREGTCMGCHVNGAPVMKEMFLPWNNWHGSFKAEYLVDGSGHPAPWPTAATTRFKTSLDIAERFETDFMIPSIKRFNSARLNSALKRSNQTGDRLVEPSGRMTAVEGQRLLRPLFETTEVNLISSRDKSGRHPLGSPTDFVPSLRVRIPDNLFLNTHLIAGGGTPGYLGLQLPEAAEFRPFAALTQQENSDLLEMFQVTFNIARGDANFAWFGPEPSLIDNDLADQLLRSGVVTPHFLAAVLAIDLESPVFSEKRASLLKYIPAKFEFKPLPAGADPNTLPRDSAQDLLTQAVVNAIAEDSPGPGSAAGGAPRSARICRCQARAERSYPTVRRPREATTCERPAESGARTLIPDPVRPP